MQLLQSARQASRPVFIISMLFMLIGALASGQSFTSSITGAVTDPSGSAVSGAKVQLKNMGTADVHNVTSQNDGSYQFNNLLPGTYQLTVTAPGFKSYVKSNLTLQAQVASTVNVPLEIGDTQQKVEVTGSAVLVDTQTANSSVTMDSHLIEALPNSTRNPLNFVFAVAGTTEAPGGQTQKSGSLDQMSSNFGLNGGRTGDESILIDGAPSQAVDWGGLMVSPLQDSVQEQQIVENSYDSQYERGGAGIVMLITKGGTDSFHGEVYDYLQNSALNANGWTNNKNGAPRGQFKQNQFGGNISGPILKRAHLFFFGGYEGLRQPNTQNTGLLTVPTAAERTGDFSQAINADGSADLIYNPFTTTALDNTGANYTRQQFAGNVIPSNLINPVGQKIVNLFPLPNRAGTGPNDINNYFAQGSGNTLNDKMDTRVDWEQSSINRMFVRWSDRFRQDQTLPCFFCNGADQGNNQANSGIQLVLNDTV
ncbi:MAG: carboxypeptidase-like regulatory domain-containing protein, partial [Acidobacteriota bacterium]|nr:carboxypeptidase-like regulatory domain-containing protein [Acidobacteriota bacterium]